MIIADLMLSSYMFQHFVKKLPRSIEATAAKKEINTLFIYNEMSQRIIWWII